MTGRADDPGIQRIREHVREQVARTSLRKVAKRAGVKVGATKKFIDGSLPYERNLRLWKRFYVRELREAADAAPGDALSPEDARMVLEMLLWGFPEAERPARVPEAARVMGGFYRGHGRTPPGWVRVLAGGEAPEGG